MSFVHKQYTLKKVQLAHQKCITQQHIIELYPRADLLRILPQDVFDIIYATLAVRTMR